MSKKVICMIPARIGSERFKQKNLAIIKNKPVLSWGIESAKNSNIFDEIIINGDNAVFQKIANSYGLNYHNRNKLLSTSESKSDDVIFDFLNIFQCDYIVWFNAIAPLQVKEDIKDFVKLLTSGKFTSLFAVKSNYIQSLYKDLPINFSLNDKFSRTQDLSPIISFVPSLMGWEAKTFLKNYLKCSYGLFSDNVGYYENKFNLSSLVIKTEDDFKLIRSVIEGIKSYNNEVKYYE